MTDYRKIENRYRYFDKLYELNLTHGIMPGLVYLYMPALADTNNWGDDDKLWFAFINGMTQNPITSFRIMQKLPEVPPAGAALTGFKEWFDSEWETLQFDTDRRYQKKDTVQAIKTYARLVADHGGQVNMLTNKPYQELWSLVRNQYHSFGRLSSFSYLEYVYLNGFGADCDDLLFNDKSGSKSHRNGMMFFMGRDDMVWDKRLDNGFDGKYESFDKMCSWLDKKSCDIISNFKRNNPSVKNVNNFTLESNLCTFKNHFFGHRYPGVYADMAWERILWADSRGLQDVTRVFKDIRTKLPEWLRDECVNGEKLTIKQKAKIFPDSGAPYRGEHFL